MRSPPCSAQPRQAGQGSNTGSQGFSLIEVITATVVMSWMIAFLTPMLISARQDSLKHLHRHQAIMAMDREMERLYAYFHYNSETKLILTDWESAQGYYPTSGIRGIHPVTAHKVYHYSNRSHVTTDLASFTQSGGEDLIYWFDNQNFVWLDRFSRIAARMSWVPDTIDAPPECYDISPIPDHKCTLVTLYLDFPYTLSADNGTPTPSETLETITLRTIMGNRYP